MSKFNKDYVHVVADNNLCGKYGYFADSIEDLIKYVTNDVKRYYGSLSTRISENGGYPFVKKENDSYYRFFYQGPDSIIVTYRELAKWLATGNGQVRSSTGRRISMGYTIGCIYHMDYDNEPVKDILVRNWEDDEWHEPTSLYLGLDR